MNLIRDGGFGRGDTKFWETIGDGVFSISDTGTMHGSYCGLLDLTIGDTLIVIPKDYIEIRFGQLLFANYYIKSSGGGVYTTKLYEYDGELNLIKTTDRPAGHYSAGYRQVQAMLNPTPATEYVRIGVQVYVEEDSPEIRIDTLYASLLNGEDALVYHVEMINSGMLIASGDTDDDLIDMLGFNDHFADIECTVLAGTNPTLDVDVVELDVYGNEKLLGSFTQLAAIGHERISITCPIGTGMYVKYTEGGTWTDCRFKVTATGVR